jgi:hypothetical protein
MLYLLNAETTSAARLAGIGLRKASRVAHGRNSEAAPIDLALRRREAASKGALEDVEATFPSPPSVSLVSIILRGPLPEAKGASG